MRMRGKKPSQMPVKINISLRDVLPGIYPGEILGSLVLGALEYKTGLPYPDGWCFCVSQKVTEKKR